MSSKAKFEPHRGQPFLVQASPGFLESVPDEDTPETLYEKHERVLKDELARLFAQLPAKEAKALRLWLSGMTQAQIAEMDGVTQAAISIRAKRGIEKLFEMREKGELGTLKFIWDGLHKLRDHINKEIELERSADSETSLPMGEELGERLGDYVLPLVVAESPPEPEDSDSDLTPVETPAAKRQPKRKPTKGLNEKEHAILRAVMVAGKPIHLKEIELSTAVDKSDYADDSRNSWVRNSLRKLVRTNQIQKLGKGMYQPWQPSETQQLEGTLSLATAA